MLTPVRTILWSAALAVAAALSVPASGATAEENWEKHCVGCHGADGRAQTRIGRKAGAKDLTNRANQAKLTDEQIADLVKNGRRDASGEEKMEAFGDRVSDAEIRELIAKVRAFAK